MRIELGVTVISGVVALTSAVVAYRAQVNVAQTQADIVRLKAESRPSHEWQKPLLQRVMQRYFDAADATSKIAQLEDCPERQYAIKQFWQLYWGPLAVVEEPEVESAMVNFGNALAEGNPARSTLQLLSLKLAHACRNSLQKLWGTDLGQLGNLREKPKQ